MSVDMELLGVLVAWIESCIRTSRDERIGLSERYSIIRATLREVCQMAHGTSFRPALMRAWRDTFVYSDFSEDEAQELRIYEKMCLMRLHIRCFLEGKELFIGDHQ